ncbi:ribosomal protein [Streptococcus dysgalactiae subsp. equisimilis GGS_124]|nr:ribosomal protein [Streptococcus dysgalactiae subsp. equisimilis GGS_124]
MFWLTSDWRLSQSNFNLSHDDPLSYAKSETEMPRSAATSSARLSCFNPSTVARTMLIGVFEPRDFEVISAIPANSMTARTAPPAATPEPSTAGFNNTLAPPKLV